MGSQTLIELLADLAAAYPNQRAQIEPGTFKIYLDDLGDLPVEAVEAAAKQLRRSSEWFPTISQIRAQVAEIMLALPSEAEGLAQVEAKMRGTSVAMHPIVRQTLDLLGGPYSWKTTDDPGVMRGQFGRIYRELRANAILDHQQDRVLAALPAPPPPARELPSPPATKEKLAEDAQRFRELSASIGKRMS